MNADMIIGWPLRQASGGNTSWMISHRTSTGHSQPQAFPTNQQTSEFSIFYPLTTTDSSGKYTTLAILRTLEPTWPTDATYVNITRAKSQSIIWAYGSDRPVGSDYQANVPQHVRCYFPLDYLLFTEKNTCFYRQDSFGRTSFDLSQTITNPAVSSGNDGTSSGNSTTTIPQVQEGDTSSQEWTKHDWLVAMHATFGCLAWLIVCGYSNTLYTILLGTDQLILYQMFSSRSYSARKARSQIFVLVSIASDLSIWFDGPFNFGIFCIGRVCRKG